MPDGALKTQAVANAPGLASHFDVVIVGAGLSGIGAACRLTRECPKTSFVILEGRDTIGGTWDLFRYPGARSDSDMHTFGYGFRPWREMLSLAPAARILAYLRETASEYGIERSIRFRHQVRAASWSGADARWTLAVADAEGNEVRLTCNLLLMCSGYYSYTEGHAPQFPGSADFAGELVHPQFWPESLDCAAKRVVVIGSGATAVTLVPELARTAAHVVMLQRSPSYVVSRPSIDPFGTFLSRILPSDLARRLTRAKNIGETVLFYKLARGRPARVTRQLIDLIRKELGADYDVGKHFTPRYKPWDQRVCFVPDSDLFKAVVEGDASIETDHVERLTRNGILLASGREIEADVIVSATGLKMRAMGGIRLEVDGQPVELGRTMAYKGMMLGDVPNFVFFVGYTNASWTLKSDLVAGFVCRLLNFMRRRGYDMFVPVRDPSVAEIPLLDFTSGYVQRSLDVLPKQGDRVPWRLHQNYLRDMPMFRFGRLKDGTLTFRRSKPKRHAAA